MIFWYSSTTLLQYDNTIIFWQSSLCMIQWHNNVITYTMMIGRRMEGWWWSPELVPVIAIGTWTFNTTAIVIVIFILTLAFDLTSVIIIVIEFRHLAQPGQYMRFSDHLHMFNRIMSIWLSYCRETLVQGSGVGGGGRTRPSINWTLQRMQLRFRGQRPASRKGTETPTWSWIVCTRVGSEPTWQFSYTASRKSLNDALDNTVSRGITQMGPSVYNIRDNAVACNKLYRDL